MPFIDQYSLVVGELGKVFDGCSRPEANRQFALFVIQSKIARSKSDGKPVTLFKNYEIVRESTGRIVKEICENLQHG